MALKVPAKWRLCDSCWDHAVVFLPKVREARSTESGHWKLAKSWSLRTLQTEFTGVCALTQDMPFETLSVRLPLLISMTTLEQSGEGGSPEEILPWG